MYVTPSGSEEGGVKRSGVYRGLKHSLVISTVKGPLQFRTFSVTHGWTSGIPAPTPLLSPHRQKSATVVNIFPPDQPTSLPIDIYTGDEEGDHSRQGMSHIQKQKNKKKITHETKAEPMRASRQAL